MDLVQRLPNFSQKMRIEMLHQIIAFKAGDDSSLLEDAVVLNIVGLFCKDQKLGVLSLEDLCLMLKIFEKLPAKISPLSS